MVVATVEQLGKEARRMELAQVAPMEAMDQASQAALLQATPIKAQVQVTPRKDTLPVMEME